MKAILLGGRFSSVGAYWIVPVALIVAFAFGLLSTTGSPLLVLGVGGGLAGLALIARPPMMVWLMFVIVLVANGMLQTFADIHQLQWGASVLGLALAAIAVLRLAGSRPGAVGVASLTYGMNGIVAFATIYWAATAFGTVLNSPPAEQIIVGLRVYLPYWGILLFVAAGGLRETDLRRVFLLMFWIALLQFPAALYQKLVIVPQRAAGRYFGSDWDSIVGTFGGGKFGGGASGSMAVFLVCVILISGALWREKLMRGSHFAILFLASMLAMGLAEAKVVFVILPLGLLFLFRDWIVKEPGKFIVGASTTVLSLAGVLFAYFKLYYEQQTRGDIWMALERRFAYSFDPAFMPASDWPGRFTGLFIWARNHSILENPDTTIVGHGIAAATSFSTLMGPSREVKRYGGGLEVTGITKLLWDSGLLGCFAFCMMFVAAYNIGAGLARNNCIPEWHRAALRGVVVCAPVLVLSMFYEVTAVSSPSIQLMSMFMLGYVIYWKKWRS